MSGLPMPGLYLHVPFCRQACTYCDFYFVTRRELIPRYVASVREQILGWQGHPAAQSPVRTLYFGGGTPSLLTPDQIGSILEAIGTVFPLSLEEFTFEANPENLSPSFLGELRELGVTRLSLGIQSFDPALLGFMHRSHSAAQAAQALRWTAEAGFDSWSADLIFANPGQTLQTLRHDLERMTDFAPPHLSTYSLTLEERTRLHRQVALGRIEMPASDEAARHLRTVCDHLARAGYERYEVSSHALPGHRARHNASYWTHEPYIGFGPAAHSFLPFTPLGTSPASPAPTPDHVPPDQLPPSLRGLPVPPGAHAVRWSAPRDLAAWMDPATAPPLDPEWLDLPTLAEERIMLGLRTAAGITRAELTDRYAFVFSERQERTLARFTGQGWLTGDGGARNPLRLTDPGMDLADRLTLDLLS